MDCRLRVLVLASAMSLGCDHYDPALKPPCERSVAVADGCGFAWECGPEGRVTVTCTPQDDATADACTCSVVRGRSDAASTVRSFESEHLCDLTGQGPSLEVERVSIVETGCGYSLRSQLREGLGDAQVRPRVDAGSSLDP